MDQFYNKEIIEKAAAKVNKERYKNLCTWHNHEEYEGFKKALESTVECELTHEQEYVAGYIIAEFFDILGLKSSEEVQEYYMRRLMED